MEKNIQRMVVIVGALLGGGCGWYGAPSNQPTSVSSSIFLGVLAGAFLAKWVWSHANED